MSNYPCPLSHFPKSHFVSDDNTCDVCELPIASEVYTVGKEQLCERCHDEKLLEELTEMITEENNDAASNSVRSPYFTEFRSFTRLRAGREAGAVKELTA